ncbi:hypothetical protein K502DRAFT_323149 [Neoconidiobolus thromboides FSU 785]|nr:hypothetical protein K502DRAFT_323149 [Neoconidiobolus thromboides FSU 785]
MKVISIISSVLLASAVSSLSLDSVYNFMRDVAEISPETQQPKQVNPIVQGENVPTSQDLPVNSKSADQKLTPSSKPIVQGPSQVSKDAQLLELENKIHAVVDGFLKAHPQIVSVISSLIDDDSSSTGNLSNKNDPPKGYNKINPPIDSDQSKPQSAKRLTYHKKIIPKKRDIFYFMKKVL